MHLISLGLGVAMVLAPLTVLRAPASARSSLHAPTTSPAQLVSAPVTTTPQVPTTIHHTPTTIHHTPTTIRHTLPKPKPKPKPAVTPTTPTTIAVTTTTNPTSTTIPVGTTTTTVQVTTTTKPKPKPARVKYGIATWYRWHPGQCATSYLPKGTRIKIRSLRTGRVVYCVVTDSQPYSKNRVVDLDVYQFAKLAPLSRGVEHVVVTW